MSSVIDSFWAALRQERFLVVGVGGITGASAARLLRRMGVPVRVSDAVPHDTATTLVSELGLRTREVFFGPQQPSQLDGITQVLVSPGVPRSLPLLQAAKERCVPIWCDYDLFYPLYADRRIAAITGTDGKTTTTSLVGHLLRPSHSVVVLGNIGTPLCAAYDEVLQSDVVVLELSSFMLEELKQFRADVATVLNVAEDHVDRYPSRFEYAETKRNIVRHALPGDVFVRNLDDPCVSSWALPGLDVRTVSLTSPADFYLDQAELCMPNGRLPINQLRIRGQHLVGNVQVALAMAMALGVAPEIACSRVTTFAGVPHRFEFVGQWSGVEVMDDSKATSMNAVARALESLSNRRTVLILGGRDKHLDPSPLSRFSQQMRAVVGYGEAGRRLLAPFEASLCRYERDFDDAVRVACQAVQAGDVLLLSPACTSFDQHRDYEERGQRFRQLAQACLATEAR